MTSIYREGSGVPVPGGFLNTIFGDSVDISFTALVGGLTGLMLFWILGIGIKDSVQCGIVAIAAIYIAKSMFDSFFIDAKSIQVRSTVSQ